MSDDDRAVSGGQVPAEVVTAEAVEAFRRARPTMAAAIAAQAAAAEREACAQLAEREAAGHAPLSTLPDLIRARQPSPPTTTIPAGGTE